MNKKCEELGMVQERPEKVWTLHVHSVLNYAGGGWQPWISNNSVEKLERTQNRGLRLITDQSMSSPCEYLRSEATVNSIRCVIRQAIAKPKEKALRLPEDHPRRVAFKGVCRSRLKRRDARSEAENLCRELGEHHRAPFQFFTVKPWGKGLGKVSVFPAYREGTTMWRQLE